MRKLVSTLCLLLFLAVLAGAAMLAFLRPAPATPEEDAARVRALAALEWARGAPPPPAARATAVVFGASWCPDCLRAAPLLERLHRDFAPRGAAVCVVSLDRPDELRAWLADNPSTNTFPLAFGTREANRAFNGPDGAREIPVAFLLAPGGRVVWSGDPAGLPSALDRIL